MAADLRSCRDCQCFWPKDAGFGRFGPLPVAQLPADSSSAQKATLQAGAVTPALLKGCRRAPTLLVGINPNLKNFSSGLLPLPLPSDPVPSTAIQGGIRTVHPAFKDRRSFLRHYRHLDPQHVRAQVVETDFESCLDAGAARLWRAPAAAEVTLGGKRPDAQRQATLHWQPEDAVVDANVWRTDVQWASDESFVVLRRRAKPGQSVAGYLSPSSLNGKTLGLEWKADGFYTHLGRLAQAMDGVAGEDLGLIDMVACASANWKPQAGVDIAQATANCVDTRQFAIRQILASRPRVLFFSGSVAWLLFVRGLGATLGDQAPHLLGLHSQVAGTNAQGQADPKIIDSLGWLRQQADPSLAEQDQLRIALAASGTSAPWHCRLIPMAHFSYPDNVSPVVHWPRDVHTRFSADFQAIVKLLQAGGKWLDPTAARPPDQYPPVFFGISLAPPSAATTHIPDGLPNPSDDMGALQSLCLMIARNHGADQPKLVTLWQSIAAQQWTDAQARLAAHQFDPLALAAQIARQTLGQPSDAPAVPAAGARRLGRWRRDSSDCAYCAAADLNCDYRQLE